MFCPKCGTQNPDDGKYCRTCGTDLGNVTEALSGKLSLNPTKDKKDAIRRQDPNEVYSDGIKSIVSGFGFLIVSIALLVTNVAGGNAWWWAMLFPAFGCFSKGISDYMKSKRLDKSEIGFASGNQSTLNQVRTNAELPPSQTDYVSPSNPQYETGDLVPPSVVENTTRHLELDSEGETMTLPKRDV